MERYRGRRDAFSVATLRNGDDAEDLVQECLVRAFRELPRDRGRGQFRAWFYRIAGNLCRDRARRASSRDVVLDDRHAEIPDPRPGGDPATAALRAAVLDALQELSETYRRPSYCTTWKGSPSPRRLRCSDVPKPRSACSSGARGKNPGRRRGGNPTSRDFPGLPDTRRSGSAPASGAGELEASVLSPYPELRAPHVTTADYWEALHGATGIPIVADYYTRVYPQTALTCEKTDLFDALCRASDELRVRWNPDGDFLMARSTAYFWDKLKEVPNEMLAHLQQERKEQSALSLPSLLQLMRLTDQKLDAAHIGMGVAHCWGIEEWGHFGAFSTARGQAHPSSARKYYRVFAELTTEQLRNTLSPTGLAWRGLLPALNFTGADGRPLQMVGRPPVFAPGQ